MVRFAPGLYGQRGTAVGCWLEADLFDAGS